MFHFRTKVSFILIFSLFFSAYYTKAQISPLYSEHVNYLQFINPAMTGLDKFPTINLSYKQYWFGTTNAPAVACFGGSLRLGALDFYGTKGMLDKTGLFSKGRMGIGSILMKESDGPLNSYCLSTSYGYYIPMNSSDAELSLGLSIQLMYYSIDRSMLDPYDQGDPELITMNNNHIVPESGFGAYFHNSQFNIGASVNDLLLTNLPYTSHDVAPNKRDFFFHSGYKFFLKYFELEPSVYMAQIDEKPFYYYGILKLYYKDYNWIAVSYKSTQSILASIGMTIHRLYFTYTFEHSISRMGTYFGGAHELMLGINVGPYERPALRKRRRI
jgi:type IX secretion system PorP/SprF family membrane protein